ncbi:hypothetical protein [Azospirillum sp. B510]|uniref:hypothetical protein n=1 Tax=Azospirillum sp. (strain B510) TaxID=137722 RepID=UPI0005A93C56|nr:hypothetical protein [Azospirillum sp. B510]
MGVADWMRRLAAVAGTMILVLLVLSLWSGAAEAACPHGRAGFQEQSPLPSPFTRAVAGSMRHASHVAGGGQTGQGRQAPGRPHPATQPCCAGMACAAMAVGLPNAEMMVPVWSAGPRLGWAAGPLREGLGLRPDPPPPRLG